jgi:branched-chain amino acid transport system ATP-binding protein
MNTALLHMNGIHCGFGGLNVLAGIDLEIQPGTILGLIGGNGAGKTTLLNVIHGFLRPHAGSIRLRGRNILRAPVHERAALGIGRVFQESRLWPDWTVEDHLSVAKRRSGSEDSSTILELLGGGERLPVRTASSLPLFQRRKLELAMATLSGSDVLLIDEIGAGLNREEAGQLYADVQALVAKGRCAAAIMVEHKLDLLISHATELCFLQDGLISGRVACSDDEDVSRLIGQILAPAAKEASR